MKFMSANRISPDGTPRLVASHLGIFFLQMPHKKDARLIWVNFQSCHVVSCFVVPTCIWNHLLGQIFDFAESVLFLRKIICA